MSKSYIPAKQFKCPRCGQNNSPKDEQKAAHLHCEGCGLVFVAKRGRASSEASPSAEARLSPIDRIKSWIDVHHLADPDELKMPGDGDADDAGEELPAGGDLQEIMAFGDELAEAGGNKPSEKGGKMEYGGVVALPAGWWKRHRATLEEAKLALREGAEGRKPLPKWLFAALTATGCLALAATIGWMVYATATSSGRWSGRNGSEDAQEDVSMGTAEIQRVVGEFVKAKTPDEILACVRNPERVRPMIENYDPRVGTGKILSVLPYNTIDNGGLLAAQFLVTFEDKRRRTVCVVRAPEGLKIDWEAYSRQGGATYAELQAGTAGAVNIRAVASPGSYYNYEFANEDRWVAFELNNGDWDSGFTGYVLRSDPLAFRLRKAVAKAKGAAAVLIRVSVDATRGRRNQCVINELLETGWVEGVEAVNEARAKTRLDGT